MKNNTIIFTLQHLGETYRIQVSIEQYDCLMSIITNYLAILGLGLCCGTGSCGTCLVQITSKCAPSERNVLACNIRINDELANTIVLIPDKIY